MHLLTASELANERFTSCVGRTLARDLSAMELIAAVEELSLTGDHSLVAELYRIWIEQNPADPLLHAVLFNYGVVLTDTGDLARSVLAFDAAISLQPDFIAPYINLGTALERAGNTDGAIERWVQAANRLAAITPDSVQNKTTALKQIGRVLEMGGKAVPAEEALRACLELHPGQRDVAQHWIALRQGQCKWPVLPPQNAPLGTITRERLLAMISPLSLAAYVDDPVFQLANAHRYWRHDVALPAPTVLGAWPRPEPGPAPRPLRIGYVSPDLRHHAVGFLVSELFALHDRSRVEVFAYYSGVSFPGHVDLIQERIRADVERPGAGHWIDIAPLDPPEAARRVIADGIDILVDLGGYTKDSPTRLFALRPAPVIVNWLGYPGTMGTPHHHYIIADSQIIPPGSERFYSERVCRLPCYQPSDRFRAIAAERPTRAEAGLPEDAMVFCCFNGTQKIDPGTFGRWTAILRAVPNSVLWLLAGDGAIEARLRELAAAAGIAPERLVFAPRQLNAEHLARYPLADLFLDTFPYGAHTTASDALWMGVPVITLPGQAFASRVCASLVHAAGLPELICGDAAAYVDLAIGLANDRPRLAALRARLIAQRDSCTLFDTPGLVRSLEDVYQGMWDDFLADRLPRPDLVNLDVIAELAASLHREDPPCAPTDFLPHYRTLLAGRHALAPLPPDRRFWAGEQPLP